MITRTKSPDGFCIDYQFCGKSEPIPAQYSTGNIGEAEHLAQELLVTAYLLNPNVDLLEYENPFAFEKYAYGLKLARYALTSNGAILTNLDEAWTPDEAPMLYALGKTLLNMATQMRLDRAYMQARDTLRAN